MKGVLSFHLLRLGVLCGVWVCVGVCPQEGLGAGTRLERDWEDSQGCLVAQSLWGWMLWSPGLGGAPQHLPPHPPPLLVPSHSPPNPGRELPQPPLSGAQPLSQTRCKHCARWLQSLPSSLHKGPADETEALSALLPPSRKPAPTDTPPGD